MSMTHCVLVVMQYSCTVCIELYICLRAVRPYWVSKLNSENSAPVAALLSPLVRAPDEKKVSRPTLWHNAQPYHYSTGEKLS